MKIINYSQDWNYHTQHHVFIKDKSGYVASAYISETDDSVQIEGVYVNPTHRGKGYGSILMEELEKIIKQKGYTQVFLKVKRSNIDALVLYEKSMFNFHSKEDPGIYNWMIKNY